MTKIQIEDLLAGGYVFKPVDREIYKAIKSGWDNVAKPLDSMGVFEELLSKIGAIQGEIHPKLYPAGILVMCADNGIVEEGVSQSDKSVTAICTKNIAAGKSGVGMMASREAIDVIAVDVGVDTDEKLPAVRDCKVRKGTRNFHREPAMTKKEVFAAIQVGMDMVYECFEKGYRLLGMGEMGIGNTTTSSAIAAALLGVPAEEVTGRGAGLDDDKLKQKRNIIAQALERYRLYDKEPLQVLATVGGLDIAALVGICIGGAIYHVPIVLDGFISMTAALVACRLFPEIRDFIIPSHTSKEPAVQRIKRELDLCPVIDAGMALGEGTGAVLMISLLRTVNQVYENSVSFEGTGIEQYKRY